MDSPTEEAEVTSTSESPIPAYSPHTHGFPPTSQSVGLTNPFAVKKAGMNPPKGNVQSTTGLSSCVLRPSKLEAGLGSNIFTKQLEEEPKTKPTEALEINTKPNTSNNEVPKLNDDELGSKEAEPKEPLEAPKVDNGENSAVKTGEQDKEKATEEEKDADSQTKVDETETSTPPSSSSSEEVKNENLSFNATPAGFVFGSNLNDRVENVTKGVSNGEGGTEGNVSTSNSIDVAKRKWEWESPGSVTTGEEDESNVMQTSCRLFAFDGENSNWIERGRGLLRLNDRKEDNVIHSRLIIRTKGSLRVMLNTPVFPQMIVEKSEEKYIKISGREDGSSSVKLFLIQCSHSDTDTLHTALEWRVRALASAAALTAGTSGTQETKVTIHQGHFDGGSPPKKQKLSN